MRESTELPPLLPPSDADAPERSRDRLDPDREWEKWRATGEQHDFERVVKSLDPTVRRGLSAFGGGNDHLLTRARIIAAEAARAYDPDKASEGKGKGKASLPTYVYSHLQRLQRVAADREAAVRLPERSRMDAIAMRDAVRRWRDTNDPDGEPDLVTLREMTGLSPSRMKLAGRAYREISAAGLETEKGDTLFQADAELENDPWRDYVYYDLDEKGRRVFEMTTGYGGTKIVPKSEIARRLKMSPAAVSSRIGTIQKRLQERPAGKIV